VCCSLYPFDFDFSSCARVAVAGNFFYPCSVFESGACVLFTIPLLISIFLLARESQSPVISSIPARFLSPVLPSVVASVGLRSLQLFSCLLVLVPQSSVVQARRQVIFPLRFLVGHAGLRLDPTGTPGLGLGQYRSTEHAGQDRVFPAACFHFPCASFGLRGPVSI
jgi:hypothetical protein